MTSPLTEQQATERYRQGVSLLERKYGSVFRAPSEEVRENSEMMRAFHVIQKYGGAINGHILSQYMIPPSIAELVLSECGGEGVTAIVPRHALTNTRRLSSGLAFTILSSLRLSS